MGNVSLSSFPSNELEALAMFYVQNVVFPTMSKDEASPETLYVAYRKALDEFKDAYTKHGTAAKTAKDWLRHQ